jgi:DNA-binding PadR family transcriptional regulator
VGKGHGGPRWRHGKHKKNFWHAWREERHRRQGEHIGPLGPPGFEGPPFSPGENAPGWRNFFHEFMGAWPEEHWAFGGRRFSPWHHGMADFNPFVASMLSKGGGLLPLYVMHLLSEQPRYGNELMELISERTGGQWMANPGAIYPLMTMLEDQELIIGEWEDPRKRTVRIYKLTEDGERELARLKTIVRPKLVEAIAVLQQLAFDLNGETEDSSFSPADHDYV